MSLDKQYIDIQRLLNKELRVSADIGRAVDLRRKERNEIKQHLSILVREVRLLVKQFQHLPPLPAPMQIRWAQSVLASSNACILTVDVDTSTGGPVLLRIHLLGVSESTLYDQVLAPGYILSGHTMRNFGITHQDLQNAHSLPHIWNSLLDVLMGKFVVCYDLERIRALLEQYARQYDLEVPVILGECLLQRVLHYFCATGFVGLPALCRYIGSPLPEPPDCTIFDRAYGQLHLLRTMAQGIAGGDAQPFLNENLSDDELEQILL